jgi:hypothetical protein
MKVKFTLEKFTLELLTKAQRGSRGIALFFLNSALAELGGQSHTPAVLPRERDLVLIVEVAVD